MFRWNNKGSQANSSKQSQFTFNIQVCPSHLTVSHNYATLIKPNTFYQLLLFKNSRISSQINQYKNLPISAKVFQGKIIFPKIHLSFTVECDNNLQFQRYYLKLYQLKSFYYQSDVQIGSYQLEIYRYIKSYLKGENKYFYQQCVIQPEVYLTYEVFIQKNRAKLQNFIYEERSRQKKQMKNLIIKKIEEKQQDIIKINFSPQQQKQLRQSLKAHLALLHHVDSSGKEFTNQLNKLSVQNKKLIFKQQELPMESPQASSLKIRNQLQVLSEQNQFSLRNSEINFKQQLFPATLKQTNKNIIDSVLSISDLRQENDEGMLKNESDVIKIDVRQPKVKNNSELLHLSSLNLKGSKSSQFSINNQYQEVRRLIMIQKQNQKKQFRENGIRKTFLLDQVDYNHQNSLNDGKKGTKQRQSSVEPSQIQVTSEIFYAQIRKTKILLILFCIVAIGLFVYLIDHPYFDVFQGKNDAVLLTTTKRSKKNQDKHKNSKKIKSKRQNK